MNTKLIIHFKQILLSLTVNIDHTKYNVHINIVSADTLSEYQHNLTTQVHLTYVNKIQFYIKPASLNVLVNHKSLQY